MTSDAELVGASIERLDVDGVPAFWLPDGRRPMVALQFRVGRADESFPEMGSTHLVEHLAFFGYGTLRGQSNGFVDNIRTVFSAQGSPDELRGFLRGITQAIHQLPTSRLSDEARILRTEAMARTPSLWELLAWFRYGAQAHGNLCLPEFGLQSPTPEHLTAWAATWFTAGNAALWIAGPMPDDLHLELPAGERRALPASEPIPDLSFPASAQMNVPGICLGLVVPRTSVATMGTRVLTKRLEQRLRYESGRSYEVSIAYMPLDDRLGQASIFASCLGDEAGPVRTTFLDVVDRLADEGPTAEELETDRSEFRRQMRDPDAGYGELDRAVHNELLGLPQDGFRQIHEEMEAATEDGVRDAFREALAHGLLLSPVAEAPKGRVRAWNPYPAWSSEAVDGKRYDRADRRLPWQPVVEQMTGGPDGITWRDAAGHLLTVRFRDCVGVAVESDGTRTLYGRDGFRVRVDPAVWRHGRDLVALIDANVPLERIVSTPS